MQQKLKKNIKINFTPMEFGSWLREKREKLQLSLRELSVRCGQSTLTDKQVSHSYIGRLEKGVDVVISPEILLMLKDALIISYEELLEHLTEKNFIKFSDYLSQKQKKIESGGFGNNQDFPEMRSFFQRAQGVSRKVIEPLLWELVNREIIGCELIPYAWPEDYWAGIIGIEEMGQSMSNLAEICEDLKTKNDPIARALYAAIEGTLGKEFIEEHNKKMIKLKKKLQIEIQKRR